MSTCVDSTITILRNIKSNISQVRAAFNVTNLNKVTEEQYNEFERWYLDQNLPNKELMARRMRSNFDFWKKSELAIEEPVVPIETQTTSDVIEPVFVSNEFMFASKQDAERSLFRGQEAALLAYHNFMHKHLIEHFFLTLNRTQQITNDNQLHKAINDYVNGLSKILIGKSIVDSRYRGGELIKENYYELNQKVNELLANKDNLSVFNPDPKNSDTGLKIVNGKFVNPRARLYMAAVTYANFNTILKEYLPVMDIESDYPGFDAENLKNVNLYKLSQKTQPKGRGFEDSNVVMDRNSRLAKLIITSFKRQNAYMLNGSLQVDFSVEPVITLANYYYVMQIVSNHVNGQNYNNEQNKLLTALVAFNIYEDGTRLISKLPHELIGKFDEAYILKNRDLMGLFSNNTLLTTLVTLYRNLASIEDDFLLNRYVPNNQPNLLKNSFSIRKYYNKFSNQPDFHKNNLFDIIYGTFQQTTPRRYHDVVFNSKFQINTTEPAEQRVRNNKVFDVLKAHRNLQGRTPKVHSDYINSISDSKMIFKVGSVDYTLTYLDGRWYGVTNQDIRNAIYEVFRQMTNINLEYEPALKMQSQFNMNNILKVVYQFGNLYEKSLTDSSARNLISRNTPLKNNWDSYSVSKDKGGVESTLMGMAKQYQDHFGNASKMTVLSKDGKPLPTYNNIAMIFNYQNRLNFLKDRPGFRKGNIFLLNSNLFVGVSSKNQIVVDGKVVEYRSQNLKDQIITDVLLEWFQKRNVLVDTRDQADKQSSNDERVVHFQPIVYSDKTMQIVIKVDSDAPVVYLDFRDPNSKQSLVFDKSTMFTHDFVNQVSDAQFGSLSYQYNNYFKYTLDGLTNVFLGLSPSAKTSPSVAHLNPSQQITSMYNAIQDLSDESLVDLWRKFNPDKPMIKDMIFSKGKLNPIQLALYDIYLSPTAFKSFGNLGLIQFLQELSRNNINQSSAQLKIFPKTGNPLATDMTTINNPKLKAELLQLDRDILEVVANSTHQELFNLQHILDSSGITGRINELLPKLSAVYQQYYWENLLFSHNFELSANGPIFLHPIKPESTHTLYSGLIQQLANSEKRNNSLQGTVIPYTINSIIGIPQVRTVLPFKEPSSSLSNPLGETGHVDNHDGGEYVTMLQRILENNSLSAYNNPKHHKAFAPGIILSGETALNSNMFKYASYSLNNLRLRASENYQNLIKTALNRPIPFRHRINLVTDYNGKQIDYSSYNLKFEDSELGIVTLKNIFKVNPTDQNDIDYTVQLLVDSDGSVITRAFSFTSLYSLYNALGAHKSVDTSSGEVIYSDQVWYVLADIVNRVGFKLTSNDFHNNIQKEYSVLSTNKLEDLIGQQSDFADSQLNVVQPLKYAFIHSILPDSCIKFGNIESMNVDIFSNPILDPITFQMSNLHQGIQQDTEHDGDTVTEVTQKINGMQLDNTSPELLGLYSDIAEHIRLSMSMYYKDFDPIFEFDPATMNLEKFKYHVSQLVYIYKRLQNQVLNSAYNIGQTQSYILGTIANFVEAYEKLSSTKDLSQEERNAKLLEIFGTSFRASLSDQNVYSSFITTLASINTKIGIRRKSQGDQHVISPHSGFMTFLTVPRVQNGRINYKHYATLTPLQFEEYLKKNPEYNILLDQRYKLVYSMDAGVGEFDLSLFNHYRINGSEVLYISNFQELEKLKERLYAHEIQVLEKDLLSGYVPAEDRAYVTHKIGRPLLPQNFRILTETSTGQRRIYSIYDTFSTKLLFALQDKTMSIEEVKQQIRNNNILNLSQNYINNISDQKILTNVLRKMLSVEYRQISQGSRQLTQEDIQFLNLPNNQFNTEQEALTRVVNVDQIDAEVILGYHYADRFNIKNTETILDITTDRIKNEIVAEVKEVEQVKLRQQGRGKRKDYNVPFYLHQPNGNVYFFDSTKVSRSNVKILTDHFVKNIDGERYVEFHPGKPILKITPELESRLFVVETTQGKNVLLFDIKSEEDFDQDFIRQLRSNVDETNNARTQVAFIENISDETDVTNYGELESYAVTVLNELFDMYPKYKILEQGSDAEKIFGKINSLAEAKHTSFLASLRYSSSRIPGQSYQSFSSIRLTNFLHDEQNTILVSDYNIWLTGGDFDIDKLYNMGYFLTAKGIFVGWNRFFNLSSYEHLEASLNLPGQKPNIKVWDPVTAPDTAIDLRDPELRNRLKGIVQTVNKKVTIKGKDYKMQTARPYTNISITNFRWFVQFYNDAIENGVILDQSDNFTELVVSLLSGDDFEPQNLQQQLENRIVHSVRSNLRHINNVVPLFSPISLKGPSDLKEDPSNINSTIQKITHIWNPVRKPQAIFSQYAGKSVVGIYAAGLKIYATISYVAEKFLQDKNPESVKELQRLLFRSSITTNNHKGYSFAGIAYDMTPETLTKFIDQLDELSDENFKELKQQILTELDAQIESSSGLDSVQLQISALISAATDNGKEMILGIINQGEETQGAYVYGLSLGFSLKQIGDIMISEPVNLILKMSKQSILLKESFRNIMSVANYFYKGVNFRHFIPSGASRNLLFTLGVKAADFETWNSADVRSRIDSKESQLRNLEVEFQQDEYEDYSDFSYDDLYEDNSNNKITYDAYEALSNYADTMDMVQAMLAKGAKEKVDVFVRLLDGGKIFAGTTQILSSNQRIPTTDRGILALISGFEDMIRNSLKYRNMEGLQTPFLNRMNSFQQPLSAQEENLTSKFDLRRFMTDDAYQQRMIEIYDKIKTDLNPLHLIYNAEHFKEMIRVVINTDKLNQKYSLIYRSLKNFMDTHPMGSEPLAAFAFEDGSMHLQPVVNTVHALNELAFNTLKNIFDDAYIHMVLKEFQSELLQTHQAVRIEHDENKGVLVNFAEFNAIPGSGQVGRKEFIQFMEKVFIPRLKEGIISPNQDKPILEIKNNKFVRDLVITDFRIRNKRGAYFTAYGIQIPKVTDDLQSKILQNELQKALYSLKGYRYTYEEGSVGQSIVDLLFLYNLVVHRKKEGEFTLTSFFDPEKLDNSLMNIYLNKQVQVNDRLDVLTINDMDLSMNGFNSNVDYRLSSGTYDEQRYKFLNISANQTTLELDLKKRVTLQDKLEYITQILGSSDLELKFNCK